MKYSKLVRDKIPEIIKSKGQNLVTHVAGDEEYWRKLKDKLTEEVEEFKKDESPEEFADLLEVIDAVATYKKFDKDAIEAIKKEKADKRGRFEKRIILDEA